MSIGISTQEPLVERLSASSPPMSSLRENTKTTKRKRGADKDPSAKVLTGQRHTKKVKTVTRTGSLSGDTSINEAIADMDNQLLADYVAQQTRRFEDQLSSVELEDKYLPAKAIKDTTSFKKMRSLDNLPAFLECFSGNTTKLWSASKKNGSPHTVIVTAAGLRAADIARIVRKFPAKEAKVAKLFAKHIKIQDTIKFLKSSRTGIAVGTPARIKDLIEQDALAVDRLERIVIDASHIDQKKRGILEMRETQVPLTQLLGHASLKTRLGSVEDGIQLLFF